MKSLIKFKDILSSHEHKRVIFLIFFVLIMAFFEVLGLASILPFIAVLSNPEVVETNDKLNGIFQFVKMYGIYTKDQFLLLLGIIVFALFIISICFRALTSYLQVHFFSMCQYTIGKRVIEGYLNKSYSWFLNRNSAELGKNVLSEVGAVVSNGIAPLLNLVVQSILAITILILLLIVDTKIAIIIGLIFGSAYFIFFKSLLSILKKISLERFKSNEWRFSAVSEAFGAVKEIKLGGLEQTYVNRFSDPAKTLAKNQASLLVINKMPRYAIEAVAFGGMLLIALYLLSQSENFTEVIPVIALYVFAGYRLMPALQQIYVSSNQIRSIIPSLNTLHKDLIDLEKSIFKKEKVKSILPLQNSIILRDINYRYPNVSKLTLKNINLSIQANSTVAIVGKTGSGKTTLVDIILGLLEAQEGKMEVDDKLIDHNNIKAWQQSVGYVSQHIYLADDTIAANIAFGLEPRHVDQQKVESAAKLAKIFDFIQNELPSKFQTKVGERGVRLSGGQLQRIGIARALYHNPKILILDEATSALDNQTEKLVMDEINTIGNYKTIILITHRVNSVKKCDQIFLIDKGEIKGQGTYDKLIKENAIFRAVANNL